MNGYARKPSGQDLQERGLEVMLAWVTKRAGALSRYESMTADIFRLTNTQRISELRLAPHLGLPAAAGMTWEQARATWRRPGPLLVAARMVLDFIAVPVAAGVSLGLAEFAGSHQGGVRVLGLFTGIVLIARHLLRQGLAAGVKGAYLGLSILALGTALITSFIDDPDLGSPDYGPGPTVHDAMPVGFASLFWVWLLAARLAGWVTPIAALRSARVRASGRALPQPGQTWVLLPAPDEPAVAPELCLMLDPCPQRDRFGVLTSCGAFTDVPAARLGAPADRLGGLLPAEQVADQGAVATLTVGEAAQLLLNLTAVPRRRRRALRRAVVCSRLLHRAQLAHLRFWKACEARLRTRLEALQPPAPVPARPSTGSRVGRGEAPGSRTPAVGQLWLADVPYAEGQTDDEGRTHKARPVVVMAARPPFFEALYVTSQNRDGREGFLSHDCSGWDTNGHKRSWIRCYEPLEVHTGQFVHPLTTLSHREMTAITEHARRWRGRSPYSAGPGQPSSLPAQRRSQTREQGSTSTS